MSKEERRARIERLYQEELEFREAMQPFHKAEMREALLLFGLGMLMAAVGLVFVVLLARFI
ncbi:MULTISPECIES: hypothetical protein [Pseudomonas]|uniref:DUF3094 domain-containing protein n=1 Tax=Pseudomonas koreensis TaxID=198620 RepID=A0A9X3BCI1_9PSED|nr:MULTISPECIES: hypothetical protein [Pseudomonas]MBV4477548.1 hypothetical protein [Pseudomonas botevensis]MCU7248178.1 hypothetical protein [Pseudomonas koreensis]